MGPANSGLQFPSCLTRDGVPRAAAGRAPRNGCPRAGHRRPSRTPAPAGPAHPQFAADHTRINVLDTALRLRSTIPFDQAFLGHSQPLEALACDRATNRVSRRPSSARAHASKDCSGVRSSRRRLGGRPSRKLATALELSRQPPRHLDRLCPGYVSSLGTLLCLSRIAGTIAAGGDAVSVWTLDDTHGTPVWRQIALEAYALDTGTEAKADWTQTRDRGARGETFSICRYSRERVCRGLLSYSLCMADVLLTGKQHRQALSDQPAQLRIHFLCPKIPRAGFTFAARSLDWVATR